MAGPADERVVVAEAEQLVAAVVADDAVSEPAADAIDRGGRQQNQVFDLRVRGQRASDDRGDGVDAADIADSVGAIAQRIAVIAGTPDQGVEAEPAVETVVAASTAEPVVASCPKQGIAKPISGQRVAAAPPRRFSMSRIVSSATPLTRTTELAAPARVATTGTILSLKLAVSIPAPPL